MGNRYKTIPIKAKECDNSSNSVNEKRFDYLFNIYLKHQDQFQQVFNIVTAIGLGWLAAECVLISVNIDIPQWVIPTSCFWAFLNLTLELLGIFHFRYKIEKEREKLIRLFNSTYPNEKNEIYQDFYSMPNAIISISIFLIVIECIAFAVLAIVHI